METPLFWILEFAIMGKLCRRSQIEPSMCLIICWKGALDAINGRSYGLLKLA